MLYLSNVLLLTEIKNVKTTNQIIFFLCAICLLGSQKIYSQKYFTKTGEVSFYSSTPLEDIKAVSHTAMSVMDLSTGQIEWAVLVRSFGFRKALMEEHFNENYMESSKFPKAKFKGRFPVDQILKLNQTGIYEILVSGDLEIRGHQKSVEAIVKFDITENGITAVCEFEIEPQDFGIKIPSIVKKNIAKIIEVKVSAEYEEFNN